jgi:hypothetical protein
MNCGINQNYFDELLFLLLFAFIFFPDTKFVLFYTPAERQRLSLPFGRSRGGKVSHPRKIGMGVVRPPASVSGSATAKTPPYFATLQFEQDKHSGVFFAA